MIEADLERQQQTIPAPLIPEPQKRQKSEMEESVMKQFGLFKTVGFGCIYIGREDQLIRNFESTASTGTAQGDTEELDPEKVKELWKKSMDKVAISKEKEKAAKVNSDNKPN